MKKTLCFMLALALFTCLLSACSGTGTSATAPAGTTSAADTQTTAPSATQATTQAATEPALWPRTIIDAQGNEIVLESAPQRVTLMHIFWMEHFLMLDAPPTASAFGNALGQIGDYASSEMYAPYLDGVEIMSTGSAREINLEAILESNPDVIVTHVLNGLDAVLDDLKQIAPVIILNYAASWQEQLMACAQIVGKEAEAQALIAEIEPAIAHTADIVSQYEDRTLSVFRTDGKDFLAQGASGYYSTFGLARPESFPETSGVALSLEAVADFNPYYIIFQHNADAAHAFVESMAASSVWQSLDAVVNGRVYFFDENMNTYGPRAMQLAADRLVAVYAAQ